MVDLWVCWDDLLVGEKAENSVACLAFGWVEAMAARWAVLSAACWVDQWVDWAGEKAASWAANLAEHSAANSDMLIVRRKLYEMDSKNPHEQQFV